jgi:hypothetical protein
MKSLRSLSLAAIGLMLACTAAKADTISFTINNPFQSTAAGGTVTFDATVTNISGQEVFLNGDNASLDSPFDQSDISDTDYNANFPLTLDPGQTVTDSLFTVTVPPGTPDGTYAGSFEITGGSDGSEQLVLGGSQDFDVEVASGASVVPEPSSVVLLASGLAGLAGGLRRRPIR